uniref:Uncharacterized protein n=1 Tax=Clastoptera arizonana TaxID=38151 RepID=A0A1B6DRU9_9HEMI
MASFHIHQDRENQVTNGRKLMNTKTSSFPQKRAALGTINSNTNFGLTQRNVKQDAKKITNKSTQRAFKIHQDKLEEGVQTVLQSIQEEKERLEVKQLQEKKINNKECTNFKPSDCLSLVNHQPINEIHGTSKDVVEKMNTSHDSFIYEDMPMSVDKSICETSLIKRSPNAAFLLKEYIDDIFAYLLESEDRNRPKANYMRRQPDVTYSMRTILIDWLVEVAMEYKLLNETLHIAVYIIDRFLSIMSVVRSKLQLLGTTAMFIASKYEEIYPPDVNEFVYITDETYTKKKVLRMENLILKVLMFDISVPTSLSFIEIISFNCNQSDKIKYLATFLCDLTLLEGDPYLAYLPSLIACSTIAVARFCLNEVEPWSPELAKMSGYTLQHLSPVISFLNDTHAKSRSISHQTIQDKYKSEEFECVGKIEPKPFIVSPL